VPAYGTSDVSPNVSARLLNNKGISMRDLPIVAGPLQPEFVQFDLLLSSLAPDEYRVEVVAANPADPRDEAKEVVIFRVTN